MNKMLSGGCLCGRVKFSVRDEFKTFLQCHCKQCQQLTGSAFASNIFTHPGNIEWLCGESNITVYEHPIREFSKFFCNRCGSGLPFINKTKTSLIVPAGSLNEAFTIQPQANIFTSEEASWFRAGMQAKCFSGGRSHTPATRF
ncbi:MAG: GFA family protein [Pseudomonadales bacterium]|nr:GFA family protein [Pseudomonadales bacterium]